MEKNAYIRRTESAECLEKAHGAEFAFQRRVIVRYGEDSQNLDVSVYELPPGKSANPYHYHLRNEELFFILSGTGLLRTPQGERAVGAGDFLFFPTGEGGAHRITNTSATEKLVYVDFDVRFTPEVAFYPDSEKVGIFDGPDSHIFPLDKAVAYYEGE